MIYEYKGKRYQFITHSKMKIGETWIPVIIYRCLYDNPDGMTWVREEDQFWKLFKRVEDGKEGNI